MGDLTEIVDGSIQFAGFQMGVGRAPGAKVDDGTFQAVFPVFLPVRFHAADRRDEILPGLGQAALPEVVNAIGVAEG